MAQIRRKAEGEATDLDLSALGLDAAASTVYGQLLRAPDADTVEIAKSTHTPRASVETALSQLVRAGLARSSDRPSGVEALRPEAALAQQISLKQRDAVDHVSRLTELREEINDLERTWRRHHRGDVEGREFEVVRGLEPANERIESVVADARTRLLSLSVCPGATVLFDETLEGLSARYLARGVDARIVVELEALGRGENTAAIQRLSMLGERFRFVTKVELPLRVVDDLAILPLDPDDTPAGIVLTRSPGVVAAAVSAFDLVWSTGVDSSLVTRPDGPREQGVDSRLPRLLATGAPDDAVARVLGVSSRTIRRQVAALMAELRVQSRLQLGVALARSGLLGTPEHSTESPAQVRSRLGES